ncbi:MAG: hypothetical protein ACM3KR_08990 [Deltaproteobacteria bacterium]
MYKTSCSLKRALSPEDLRISNIWQYLSRQIAAFCILSDKKSLYQKTNELFLGYAGLPKSNKKINSIPQAWEYILFEETGSNDAYSSIADIVKSNMQPEEILEEVTKILLENRFKITEPNPRIMHEFAPCAIIYSLNEVSYSYDVVDLVFSRNEERYRIISEQESLPDIIGRLINRDCAQFESLDAANIEPLILNAEQTIQVYHVSTKWYVKTGLGNALKVEKEEIGDAVLALIKPYTEIYCKQNEEDKRLVDFMFKKDGNIYGTVVSQEELSLTVDILVDGNADEQIIGTLQGEKQDFKEFKVYNVLNMWILKTGNSMTRVKKGSIGSVIAQIITPYAVISCFKDKDSSKHVIYLACSQNDEARMVVEQKGTLSTKINALISSKDITQMTNIDKEMFDDLVDKETEKTFEIYNIFGTWHVLSDKGNILQVKKQDIGKEIQKRVLC